MGSDDKVGAGSDDAFYEHLIAFRGGMVAAATHEFQNHLAVIKEYNGLVRDLLQARKPDKKTIKRCVEISGSIEERARRAAGSIDMLNRFAHREDSATSRFRAGEVVAELVFLLGRHAAGKKVFLEFQPASDEPEISGNPVLLQFLLYLLTMPLIDAVGTDCRIIISANAVSGPVTQIRIVAEPVDQTGLKEVVNQEVLATCLGKLGAEISTGQQSPLRREIVVDVGSNTGR